jgi:hypothetical protein
MGACRQVSSALAALASGTWTVQVDSPGDSRRDESDYVHVASSGTSAASDTCSAIGVSRLSLAWCSLGQHALELAP